MVQISGTNLPLEKTILIALTSIFGIGIARSKKILTETNISKTKKSKHLKDIEIARVRAYISEKYEIEGSLRKRYALDIKRHVEIGSRRGRRHRVGLPVRGQRTRTNASTFKNKTRKKSLSRINKR
jgi:small subunit ribosomal protein S13